MLNKAGVYVIIALILVFVALHLAFAPEEHDTRTTVTVMLGGIGFLLMSCSVFLSTRLGVFEDWFGGLDRMYQVHRVAGVFAAILALVHFFGVPDGGPDGPGGDGGPPFGDDLPIESGPLGMLALIFLVIGLFASLNRKIRYSTWRPFHRLMALVYVLVIVHAVTAPAEFFNLYGPSGMFLGIVSATGVVSLVYSVFGMNRRTALPYEIEAVRKLERATEVTLRPLGEKLAHRPGQFAFVEVEGKGWDEPHPFTISSAPGEDSLRFTIKVLGDWTRKVRDELSAGLKVKVRGPYGRFDSAKASDRQVWIAGGIGLTPFLSKLREMKGGDPRRIHLVYASRDREDAIFLDELQGHADRLGNVTVEPLFSEQGQFARVDRLKQSLPEPLGAYEFFMCGPVPMIGGIMKDLSKEGVARGRIHTEAFEFR